MSRDPVVTRYLRLSTPNVSDALDRLDLAGAPRGIGPLWPACARIAGWAMTLRLVPGGPGSPVRGTLEAVQAAAPGDVLVIDHGGRADANSFGGIAAFTAVRRGIAGVVIDGVSRDVDEMKGMGFPAYGRGIIQQSVRGRCAYDGHAIEVAIAGVPVRPGDLVMADENGVVVVPRGRADEASLIAEEVAASEERVKAWIAAGVDPVEAHERVRYEGGSPGRKA